MNSKDIITHPISAGSAVFGVVATLFNIGAIDIAAAFMWGNLQQMFFISSLAVTISTHTPIPEQGAVVLLTVVGVGLLLKTSLKFGGKLSDKLD